MTAAFQPPAEPTVPVADASEATHDTGTAGEQHSPRSALLWSYTLALGRFATTAIVTVVMAALLDPRSYGVMALAMVWVTFAQTLALNATPQAVIQRDEVTDRHYDAAFWVTVAGSVVLAAVFAATAPLWASLNGAPELALVCWWLAPAIVLNGLVVVPDAIMRRHLQFKRLSLRVLIAGMLSGIAGIAVAAAGYGVWALVVQQITLTTFSAVAVWAAVRWRPRFAPIRPALRDIRAYSLHSTSGFLANFLSTRTDALILGAFFGPTSIGLYRFATRITDTVTEVAVGGLGQVSLPHLSRFHTDRPAFASRLTWVVHAGSVLSFPVFGVLYGCAGWLLTWIGPQWTDATAGLRMLCVGGAVGALGAIFGAALQAAGRPGTSAAIGWGMAIATMATMSFVGIGLRDGTGPTQVFAIALVFTVIHAIATLVASVIVFRRILRTPLLPAVRPAVPAMVSGLTAGLAGWALQPLLGQASSLNGLLVTGTVTTLIAGAVLFGADATVRGRALGLLTRALPRRSAEPAVAEHIPG
jgi:PST family polysaccharide transporter